MFIIYIYNIYIYIYKHAHIYIYILYTGDTRLSVFKLVASYITQVEYEC